MTKITSRSSTDNALVEQLKACLTNNSLGAFHAAGSSRQGVAQVGDDLPTLVNQADSVIQGMAQTLEHVAVDLAVARTEAAQYSLKVDELESIVESLLEDVGYDEALDDATTVLMEGIASSGAGDFTSLGELEFDTRITLTKADFKPYLQQAITRWIEARLAG